MRRLLLGVKELALLPITGYAEFGARSPAEKILFLARDAY
jgi:hypothetical protein